MTLKKFKAAHEERKAVRAAKDDKPKLSKLTRTERAAKLSALVKPQLKVK
jgi:hypothetical protein